MHCYQLADDAFAMDILALLLLRLRVDFMVQAVFHARSSATKQMLQRDMTIKWGRKVLSRSDVKPPPGLLEPEVLPVVSEYSVFQSCREDDGLPLGAKWNLVRMLTERQRTGIGA